MSENNYPPRDVLGRPLELGDLVIFYPLDETKPNLGFISQIHPPDVKIDECGRWRGELRVKSIERKWYRDLSMYKTAFSQNGKLARECLRIEEKDLLQIPFLGGMGAYPDGTPFSGNKERIIENTLEERSKFVEKL